MAITTAVPVCQLVSDVLHQTVKGEIRQRFTQLILKDIEPILEEYTKDIVMRIAETRDPYSIHDIKLHVSFKLPEVKA
jgi:hypothetical protein